jgi:hypothetical protein
MYNIPDFDAMLEPFREKMREVSARYQNIVNASILRLIKQFRDFLAELDKYYSLEDVEKYIFVCEEMRKFGWTVSYKNPYIDELHVLINSYYNGCIERNEYIERVDSTLLKFITDFDLVKINEVVELNPDRKILLSKAIDLYKQKNYDASIPLLLIQLDGLSRDILRLNSRLSVFTKRNYEENIRSAVHRQFNKDLTDKEDIITRMIIANITVFDNFSVSMTASSNDIESLFNECKIHSKFSRHSVLHGIDCSYGNELNAAKSLSFLIYLKEALPILLWIHEYEDES